MQIPITDTDRENILGKLLPILIKEKNSGIIKAMSSIKESIQVYSLEAGDCAYPMKILTVVMHAIYRKECQVNFQRSTGRYWHH